MKPLPRNGVSLMENDGPLNFLVIVLVGGLVVILSVFSVEVIKHLLNDRAAGNFLIDIDSSFAVIFASNLILVIFAKVADDMPQKIHFFLDRGGQGGP